MPTTEDKIQTGFFVIRGGRVVIHEPADKAAKRILELATEHGAEQGVREYLVELDRWRRRG